MWLFFIESTMNMILELSCHSNYQLKDIWKCLVGICRLFKHDRHYLQRKWINLVRPKSLIKTNNTLFHEHILTTYILYIHTVEWDLLLVWQSVCVVDKDVNSLMYVIRLNRNQAFEIKEGSVFLFSWTKQTIVMNFTQLCLHPVFVKFNYLKVNS